MACLRSLLIGLAALLISLVPASAQFVEIPPLTGPVVDRAGVLGGSAAQLAAELQALKDEKGSEVAVLTVPTTQPETIEQYGIRVVDAWKLGRKGIDDGVLLLVAVNDRQVRLEVGRGLEGDIPDLKAFRIIQEIILPKFRQGDLPGGIGDGASAITGLIRGVDLPAPSYDDSAEDALVPFVIFGFFIIGSILASTFGSAAGSSIGGIGGFLVALLITSMAGAIFSGLAVGLLVFFREPLVRGMMSSGRGGRYGSGGRGWGYGGSGGSFGGGSFGSGGGFSGGGASGRW